MKITHVDLARGNAPGAVRRDRAAPGNHVTLNIGAVTAGKTLSRVDLGFDDPGGNGAYRGYADDISLTG